MLLPVLFILLVVLALAFGILCVRNAHLKHQIALIDAIDRHTKSLMCIVDLSTVRIVSASNSVLSVIGISREEVGKHDPREMIHPDDLELLLGNLQTARGRVQKGYPTEKTFDKIKIRIRDVDYGWQWYELNAFFFHFRSHELLCCSFFLVDEQMRVREELLSLKSQMAVMLNNSFNVVWKLDGFSRQLSLITPVSRERFGVDDRPAGPIPSNEEVFLAEDILKFREMLNGRIAALSDSGKSSDAPVTFTVRVKNRDGSVVPFLTRSTLEKDAVGQFVLYGVSQRVPCDK